MTGLEKILKHIEDDAKAAANAVKTQADMDAAQIIAAAEAEKESKCAQIVQKSKSEVSAFLNRAESAALLQEKKLILNTKQQIIADVIEKAKVSLSGLSDEEYFEIIIQMVKKHALSRQGEILFSKSDKKRVPDKFNATLKKTLAEKEDALLTVSEQTCDIDGGFVLIYGDVEENCSFDALFLAARESLQDKVNALLFE